MFGLYIQYFSQKFRQSRTSLNRNYRSLLSISPGLYLGQEYWLYDPKSLKLHDPFLIPLTSPLTVSYIFNTLGSSINMLNFISSSPLNPGHIWKLPVLHFCVAITLLFYQIICIIELPQGSEMVVTGDLNADLAQPEEARMEEQIVAALTAEVLEDMLAHFLL